MTRLQLIPPVSSVSSAASSASQPSPAAAAADCASDPTPAHTPGPLMALPDKFSGDPEQCVGFLMQCELFLRQQPSLYPTEEAKVSLVCSLLTGAAREWIAALWTGGSLPFHGYTAFTQQLREVFNHPADGKDAGAQLYGIKQGWQTAAAYSLRFRTLAARMDWTNSALTTAFREGLTTELQRELACRDEGLSLDNLIALTIKLDNLLRARQPRHPAHVSSRGGSSFLPGAPGPGREPMQLGSTQLSPKERARRVQQDLCLYCGQPGHIRNTCPNRQPRRSAEPVGEPAFTLTLPITLHFDDRAVKTQAMIDSGAAGNFIDLDFARYNVVPLLSCDARVAVTALDGRPLGSGQIRFLTQDLSVTAPDHHYETLRLFAIDSPRCPVILRLPWLEKHNPNINWSVHKLMFSSAHCRRHCLQGPQGSAPAVSRPIAAAALMDISTTGVEEGLPVQYRDLQVAFSKQHATQLPPHRSYDCAIDLLPGAVPTRGRVFPLSQPESAAMQAYIQEELAKGFIRPSASPASAGFFFVKKKDGGLRPCVDYR
uniref:CCHC-type domain-containing protein n=1 Tax=Oryzias melastigma TaxID=30732 RepID=A0A3B3BTZ1_ORYME